MRTYGCVYKCRDHDTSCIQFTPRCGQRFLHHAFVARAAIYSKYKILSHAKNLQKMALLTCTWNDPPSSTVTVKQYDCFGVQRKECIACIILCMFVCGNRLAIPAYNRCGNGLTLLRESIDIVHPTSQFSCCRCCCLHIKPFFLPNVIGSTPSVLPESSSQREKKQMSLQNPGRQIKCQRTGHESTTKNATREIRTTNNQIAAIIYQAKLHACISSSMWPNSSTASPLTKALRKVCVSCLLITIVDHKQRAILVECSSCQSISSIVDPKIDAQGSTSIDSHYYCRAYCLHIASFPPQFLYCSAGEVCLAVL